MFLLSYLLNIQTSVDRCFEGDTLLFISVVVGVCSVDANQRGCADMCSYSRVCICQRDASV